MTTDGDEKRIDSKSSKPGREADRTVEIRGGALNAYIKLYGQETEEVEAGGEEESPAEEE